MSPFATRTLKVTAIRWKKHEAHERVRPPCGGAIDAYSYGMVDTPQGAKPIEPGDWLVIDEAGNAAPWPHELFSQIFVPITEGIFA